MTKLLFFQWHSFMNQGMERALRQLNVEYDTFFYQFTDWENDEKFCELFRARLKEGCYQKVLSVNFSPLISMICEELGILYIAWVYDSPVHIHNLQPMKNSCSRIYFFDRGQAEEYKKQGIDARHMPLAVDTEVFGRVLSGGQREKYRTDISLVGKLYRTEYAYFTAPLGRYLQGYLEGIVSSQRKVSGGYLIPELITEELLDRMNNEYDKVSKDGFQMGARELEFMLSCETTGRERYTALALLAAHYQVDLYSNDRDEGLQNVRWRGYADYYTQMPLIFAASRVNLNITLKTIRSGIPLRVMDIMGCGGFVLTNYQEEIAEYFSAGEECAVYENMEDLFLKAKFYLANDEERRRVAAAGYERVKRDFAFADRLGRMLQ